MTLSPKRTQADRVFAYMEDHGSVTYRQMMLELCINSPRDVIRQLKKDGVPILTERIKYIKKDGTQGFYHRFSIKES